MHNFHFGNIIQFYWLDQGIEVEKAAPDYLDSAPWFSSKISFCVKGEIPKKLLPAPPLLKLIGVKELTFLCVFSGRAKIYLISYGNISFGLNSPPSCYICAINSYSTSLFSF